MRYHMLNFIIFFSITVLVSCKNDNKLETSAQNLQNKYTKSIEDKQAAVLVEKMMEAMGGNKNWDELSYVSWTFFGARHLIWDKGNNRVRIESPRDSSIYLVNMNDLSGKYSYNGERVMDAQLVSEKMKRGKSMWTNDMYWLFMPFKLYDKGVNVTYQRTDTTLQGITADVLELTFDEVGYTPDNKYEVYIDQEDGLIKQWNFYAEASQDSVSKIWPWDNYKNYNGLLLSSDRSDKSGPSNVRVYPTLDDKVFTSFDPFEYY